MNEIKQMWLATFETLAEKAKEYDSFPLFREEVGSCENINEFLAKSREILGEEYSRPVAFERYRRIEAYAYDQAHPCAVYKRFYIVFGDGIKDSGVAYSLEGEAFDEEWNTRESIAHRWNTTPEMVRFDFIDRDGLGDPLPLHC